MFWKEVVASLYAWDLLDEGLEHMLDVLQKETLTNSVYLVALMHDEKRPLTDFYYHHIRELTGAELSHTWVDKERAAGEFADVVQCDASGRQGDAPRGGLHAGPGGGAGGGEKRRPRE